MSLRGPFFVLLATLTICRGLQSKELPFSSIAIYFIYDSLKILNHPEPQCPEQTTMTTMHDDKLKIQDGVVIDDKLN